MIRQPQVVDTDSRAHLLERLKEQKKFAWISLDYKANQSTLVFWVCDRDECFCSNICMGFRSELENIKNMQDGFLFSTKWCKSSQTFIRAKSQQKCYDWKFLAMRKFKTDKNGVKFIKCGDSDWQFSSENIILPINRTTCLIPCSRLTVCVVQIRTKRAPENRNFPIQTQSVNCELVFITVASLLETGTFLLWHWENDRSPQNNNKPRCFHVDQVWGKRKATTKSWKSPLCSSKWCHLEACSLSGPPPSKKLRSLPFLHFTFYPYPLPMMWLAALVKSATRSPITRKGCEVYESDYGPIFPEIRTLSPGSCGPHRASQAWPQTRVVFSPLSLLIAVK